MVAGFEFPRRKAIENTHQAPRKIVGVPVHVAIYYKQDGERIPNPGIIVMGKIDFGAETLDVPGSIKAKIDLIEWSVASRAGE